MNILPRKYLVLALGLTCSLMAAGVSAATYPTLFNNTGSIANTKHNLSQSSIPATHQSKMDVQRNNYGEVCVYCHTPHGANLASTAPLWNRTLKDTTFITYNQLGTASLTQTVRQPGGSSLTCLSCHDGQTAIDSIINMPGAFRNQGGAGAQANQYTLGGITNSAAPFSAADQTKYKLSATFLNTWTNADVVPLATDTLNHAGFNSNMTSTGGKSIGGAVLFGQTVDIGCMQCHSPDNSFTGNATGSDFSLVLIGTDLRNDHPVGVTFPAPVTAVEGWNTPSGVGVAGLRYFDNTGTLSGRLDKADIRIYGAGKGGAVGAPSATVECASCHDPHGVPDPTSGTGKFNPTFLRVNNAGSKVCLTCHAK